MTLGTVEQMPVARPWTPGAQDRAFAFSATDEVAVVVDRDRLGDHPASLSEVRGPGQRELALEDAVDAFGQGVLGSPGVPSVFARRPCDALRSMTACQWLCPDMTGQLRTSAFEHSKLAFGEDGRTHKMQAHHPKAVIAESSHEAFRWSMNHLPAGPGGSEAW